MSEEATGQRTMGGVMTAIVTPFRKDGAVDTEALQNLVRWQVDEGVGGIVPCGTTGEGATLDPDEQFEVVSTVTRAVAGRVPVVAGCGSNNTRLAVAAAKRVAEAGADALLVVTPYYNKPNRSGMLDHYRAVSEATPLPVVVYNVPGRTGQDLGIDLTLELAELPGLVAVKEASGNLDQISAILSGRPDGFKVFSGDDSLTLPTVALGAEGVISVVSNEAPREMSALVDAVLNGDLAQARRLHFRLLPLMQANFAESNPVPVKTALHEMGRCSGRVRAPLGAPAPSTKDAIRRALLSADLQVSR